MHSRAYMFLERDYVLLQRHPAWGIEAHPLNEENFFEWTATIQGLKDTLWEGGVFVVSLKFPENYNDEPPDVHFHTIPFHPNIDMKTGRPCVDFLDDVNIWRDSYSLHYILLSLQFLLSNPVIENAINLEAANICEDQPDLYMHTVLDCVRASQHLFSQRSNDRNQEADDKKREIPTDSETRHSNHLSKVSFDEYLTTWTGIATSKPQINMKNPLLEAIKRDSKLQAAHFGLTLEDLQEQMKKQLNEHNAIMYGNFGKKQKTQDAQERRLDQISKMKKIYLPRRSAPPPSTAAQSESGEPWDGDVEDLVAWTNELDEDDLEF
ncbi:ubiquitin-conjugating enzyme E2 U-like [Apostichopus japonicus]|uniref:ubiquitin-conjugating enzyme E2 U-like n=1 Tax=Stichopus japonicus TaxID=307972 RepID=UPI003AB7CF96